MAPNSVLRYKNTLNTALNCCVMETGIEKTNPFAGLVIKAAGSSQADRHPINDERVEQLTITLEDDLLAWPSSCSCVTPEQGWQRRRVFA